MAYANANANVAVRPFGFDTTRLVRAFKEWRLYRNTFAELDAMTDRELADLGLSRFEIPRVAREAVYGA